MMEKNNIPKVTYDTLPRAIENIWQEILILKKTLSAYTHIEHNNIQTDYITPKEVATMLKCDLSTVHNWQKKGKLKKYLLGNRAYYKRNEVEDALKAV
ncbi:MAG: helix-turn-helix domain-containing protein [Flavobacteriales bacterium]|nr:helix-turn-helix domain-containing protein [Flavobacteriales bacterium]